jgi:outer membrane protein
MRRTLGAWRVAASVLALSAAGDTLAAAAHAQAAEPLPAGPARTMSVADCVAIALRQSPDALASEAAYHGAEADRSEVRGAFGPKLHVDAALQQYNSAFNLPFGGQNFEVRGPLTFTGSVTLTQPLSSLFPIYDQYKIQDLGVDVAAIERAATRNAIALQTVTEYYRVLEAIRLAAVSDDSVKQLEAQEKQAQSQFTNGVIGKNDLLRAGLALASARQRAIQTHGEVVLERGQLAAVMGLSPDEEIDPVPFAGEPPLPDGATLEQAEGQALARRVELQALDHRIEQGRRAVSVARDKLFPVINLVGNYTNAQGSKFNLENSAYVGLLASWDVWDWGTTSSGIGQADARLQQAIVARKKLGDQVQIEARQAYVNAGTATQALVVARTAVSQAEENYRIVTKKFEANAATSFDVVDAEALLTQTRGQVEAALYDSLIALAALQKATGAPLPGQ